MHPYHPGAIKKLLKRDARFLHSIAFSNQWLHDSHLATLFARPLANEPVVM